MKWSEVFLYRNGLWLSLFFYLAACQPTDKSAKGPEVKSLLADTSVVAAADAVVDVDTSTLVEKEELPAETDNPSEATNHRIGEDTIAPFNATSYPWLTAYNPAMSIQQDIAPPRGAKRIEVRANSFGNWLRNLPLKDKGTAVYLYNQEPKINQGAHHRVIDIDTGNRDLQQCADAVMRLKAEYHYSQKAYEQIHFNFTSGDRVSFDDWRRGRKPIIRGNQVVFSTASGPANNSYANFKKYLRMIFSYAGTASLEKELKATELSDMAIGDVFIQGGFPGHAVLVMDMAVDADGQKYFLLAQSYMPAQDMHILKNPENPTLSPWYAVHEIGEGFATPEWPFKDTSLRRF
ncbi:MAG: DUF4846 domain-containing protein [Bacteroidota bacterium]